MLSSVGLLGSVVVLSTSGAGVAAAAPGVPGVPNAPVTVYTEDFENGVGADPVSLTAYTGAGGTTYTAAAPWLTACNGSILEFNAPDSAIGLTSCPPVNGSFNRVRQLAHALGQHDEAADPATNHAVTAYTEGSNPGAGLVQFEMVDPIPLLASNRFVTFSVDAAAQNCFAAHPLFGFYLLDGDQVIPTFIDGDPIDPCSDAVEPPYTAPAVGGSGPDSGISAGTFTANNAYLFSGSELGIRMVNFQGSGGGNDAAFDNIRILDATPQLYKAYSAPTQTEGLPVTLTFTITNTAELGGKAGWSFTDTLPAGMTVADPASVATTCPSGVVTAAAGGSTVAVTGNLAVGQATCTASVNVTAGAGTYVNGPGNITGIGVDAPPPATVTFDAIDPSLSLVKNSVLADSNTNGVADAGESVQYSFDVTNTGNIAINPVTIDDSKVGAVTCPTGVLAAGATITCVAATYIVTQADVDAGVLFNEATATGTPVPPPGFPVIPPVDSAPAEDELPVPAAAPSISVVKSAVLTDTNDNGTAEVGESIQFNFVVTNTGNVTLSNVSVDDPKAGAVTCPVTQLAPGQNTMCSADALYVVTQADVDGGVVINTATASGLQPVLDPANPPAPVQSDPSISETPVPEAAPSLSLLKLAVLEDVNENGAADLGERVAYGFVVTNTGNVTLTGIAIDDPKAGTVTCVDQPVGPGLSVICEADEPYIVTQADIDAGEVFNSATASGLQPVLDPENPPAPTVSEPSEISIPATFAPAVSVEKNGELIDDNDNGTADVGESIEYSFLVTNAGNVTLTEIAVDDPKAGVVTCPTEPLAPGAQALCAADELYVVTQADVDAGWVVNNATASALPPVNDPENPPATVTSAPAVDEVPATLAPALDVVKEAELDDTNGNGVADAGESIAYSFVVTNSGNVTLTEIAVLDPKAGAITCPTEPLAPGEQALCTADALFVVTQADVDAGVVLNTATAVGTTPQRLDGTGGEPVTSPESTVEVPVPAPAPALEIEKLAVLEDLNDNGTADVGEKIAYTFAVANTGNVTLTDVTVDDPKAGAVTCAVTVLAPLEVTACIADEVYVVTAADVAAGGVHNVATAWGTAPDGTTQVQSAQAEVTTPATVPAPAPAPTPAPAPVKPPALAATGSHGELLVPLALALLAFGALTVLVTRRRSTQS